MITFTLQQALDTVVSHLLNGGIRSVRANPDQQFGGPSCLYRGDNGAKCFVGVLMPDDLYNPTWDDPEGDPMSAQTLCEKGHIDSPDLAFAIALNKLQSIHDLSMNWDDGVKFNSFGWDNLKRWALTHNLVYPENAP